MLFTRDGFNGVPICNNGFDWLNSNKHIAVFHTEAYRWAQKSVFLVGLKLILVGLKLILVPLKIILVGLKIILVGLKLILVPLKIILVGLKLILVPLKLFLVPLKIQTFEPNGTPYEHFGNADTAVDAAAGSNAIALPELHLRRAKKANRTIKYSEKAAQHRPGNLFMLSQ